MNLSARRFARTTSLVALYIFGAACTAHQKPSATETNLANFAKDIVIPMEAENLRNPFRVTPQTAAEGKELFLESCAICHGTDGHSQTNLGQGMYPPAMDLTSPHVQHWKDAELFWIIQNGVRMTGMASWKNVISPQDSWKLVAFIRNLTETNAATQENLPSGSASKSHAQMLVYGRTLYRQEGCFTCHRLDGEGGKVGPDLSLEGTRGRSAEWLTGHFKNPPDYTPGSIMPAFKNLTNEQLSALTAFLLSQKGEHPSKQ